MVLAAKLEFTLDRCSWSENYYLSPPEEDSLGIVLDRLVNTRMDIAARPTTLTRGSIWDVASPGVKVKFDYHYQHRYRFFTFSVPVRDPEIFAEIPEHVVMMKFQTALGSDRTLHLGGIPVQALTNPNVAQSSRRLLEETFKARLDTFRDKLLALPLNLQIREFIPEGDLPHVAVDVVSQADSGLYRLTVRQAFPAVPGMQIRFLGCRGNNLSRLRGLRRIRRVINATTFEVDRGPLPEKGPVRYEGGAFVVGVGYQYGKGLWVPLSGAFHQGGFNIFFARPVTQFPYDVGVRQRGGWKPKRRGRNHNQR